MKISKIAACAIGLAVIDTMPAALRADDIVSIKSDQANLVVTAPGTAVDVRLSLAGTFVLTNAYGGVSGLLPQLRLTANGEAVWATLYALSQYKLAGYYDHTDV